MSLDLSAVEAAREPGVADRVALIAPAEGLELRFGELADRVARAARALADLGVRAGDRVAIASPQSSATVVAILACIEIGAAIVPIHPRLTPIEEARQIDHARPEVVLRGDEVESLGARAAAWEPSPIDPDLDIAVVFTSGTSGSPKAALLPRRAFVASARASAANLGWMESDRWLGCMPLCHVGGLSILTRCLIARRCVVLVPRFDPNAVLEAIERHGATLLSVVPTMLRALLEVDRHGALASLRAVLLGGAASPRALLDECAKRRVRALTTYGLTEACSQVTAQAPRDPGTVELGSGRALERTAVRIGARGTIEVRSPTLFRGYDLGNGGVDASAIRDGWFDTGDVGEIDDTGRLMVHARRSDLVVTGGENVSPVEVEHALEVIPGVRRALVFGVPDDRWGQLVACAIELDQPSNVESIVARASADLAPHKRPRRACVVDRLALTPAGKLERRDAVARYGASLRALGRVAISAE